MVFSWIIVSQVALFIWLKEGGWHWYWHNWFSQRELMHELWIQHSTIFNIKRAKLFLRHLCPSQRKVAICIKSSPCVPFFVNLSGIVSQYSSMCLYGAAFRGNYDWLAHLRNATKLPNLVLWHIVPDRTYFHRLFTMIFVKEINVSNGLWSLDLCVWDIDIYNTRTVKIAY